MQFLDKQLLLLGVRDQSLFFQLLITYNLFELSDFAFELGDLRVLSVFCLYLCVLAIESSVLLDLPEYFMADGFGESGYLLPPLLLQRFADIALEFFPIGGLALLLLLLKESLLESQQVLNLFL